MNKKNITPHPAKPVDRIPTGQLSSALAELSEDALSDSHVLPSFGGVGKYDPLMCSYDGDHVE